MTFRDMDRSQNQDCLLAGFASHVSVIERDLFHARRYLLCDPLQMRHHPRISCFGALAEPGYRKRCQGMTLNSLNQIMEEESDPRGKQCASPKKLSNHNPDRYFLVQMYHTLWMC
jgi:hypothetical protein